MDAAPQHSPWVQLAAVGQLACPKADGDVPDDDGTALNSDGSIRDIVLGSECSDSSLGSTGIDALAIDSWMNGQ